MKNEYEVTYQFAKSLMLENKFSGVRLVFFIGWIFLGLVTVSFAVVGFYSQSIFGYYFLLLSLFCIYRAFVRDMILLKKQYSQLVKIYGKENWKKTISFDDDFITVANENSLARYNYKDITGIIEKDEWASIIINKAVKIKVHKESFVDSDWETCEAFLADKMKFSEEH